MSTGLSSCDPGSIGSGGAPPLVVEAYAELFSPAVSHNAPLATPLHGHHEDPCQLGLVVSADGYTIPPHDLLPIEGKFEGVWRDGYRCGPGTLLTEGGELIYAIWNREDIVSGVTTKAPSGDVYISGTITTIEMTLDTRSGIWDSRDLRLEGTSITPPLPGIVNKPTLHGLGRSATRFAVNSTPCHMVSEGIFVHDHLFMGTMTFEVPHLRKRIEIRGTFKDDKPHGQTKLVRQFGDERRVYIGEVRGDEFVNGSVACNGTGDRHEQFENGWYDESLEEVIGFRDEYM